MSFRLSLKKYKLKKNLLDEKLEWAGRLGAAIRIPTVSREEGDLSTQVQVYTCTVSYTGQVTYFKVPEKHGHVKLFTLY